MVSFVELTRRSQAGELFAFQSVSVCFLYRPVRSVFVNMLSLPKTLREYYYIIYLQYYIVGMSNKYIRCWIKQLSKVIVYNVGAQTAHLLILKHIADLHLYSLHCINVFTTGIYGCFTTRFP